jgi:hypothetical protein
VTHALIVEDDPRIGEIIERVEGVRGFVITVAADGDAGIEPATELEHRIADLDKAPWALIDHLTGIGNDMRQTVAVHSEETVPGLPRPAAAANPTSGRSGRRRWRAGHGAAVNFRDRE